MLCWTPEVTFCSTGGRRLDGLHEALTAKGVVFAHPPHDEPWERSMTAYDPDGHSVEFAQEKRGHNQTAR